MIVVDASVLVHALTNKEELGKKAKERMAGQRLYAPDVVSLEVTHTLRNLVLGKKIVLGDAELARQTFGALLLERVPHWPYMGRIWELRDNYSVYDAAYISLAESLGATLVTSDARLSRGRGARCEIDLVA
ncbi:type II toxin-antitoxin system VapC family toxin [Thermobifida alba]|uniref:Ribonuclease VapC n=1 Tax=Thermobifida alba TaxID=53522 RepID=A0ABY4KWU8_THEAE|nr:type II toxin-antitoxin system VapC family toxin [Thermobifida alba]UPT19905.1 type II toxin-antitoxin system VapC family toxin [Thermobifida alba]